MEDGVLAPNRKRPTVRRSGRKSSCTMLLDISWDRRKDRFGPSPGMIMAVLESAPELRGVRVRNWGTVEMHERSLSPVVRKIRKGEIK